MKCCAQYQVNKDEPHKCYHATCRYCGETNNVYEHKCYIQCAADTSEKESKKKAPPLFVFGDFECFIEEDDEGKNVSIADLIRYAIQGKEDVSHAYSGDTCIEQFIHALNELRRCAHYHCSPLWMHNFQDGGEGREISHVICFVFNRYSSFLRSFFSISLASICSDFFCEENKYLFFIST